MSGFLNHLQMEFIHAVDHTVQSVTTIVLFMLSISVFVVHIKKNPNKHTIFNQIFVDHQVLGTA